MDESRFNQLADEMLTRIEAALADCDADFDYELKPGGVIELEFSDGGRIIINRHTAAREIWVAARSGGFHFKPEGDIWVNTRDGPQLIQVLEQCMSEQTGARVDLGLL
ncbi:MAG: iron donor protein CyaY [Georgfuchsia sp.]